MQFVLIFINYFLMLSVHYLLLGVYCAESSDISPIEDSLKDLTIENQNKTSETTILVKFDESKVKMKEQKEDTITNEKSKLALVFVSEPLAAKGSREFFNNIEIKTCDYLSRFDSILDELIPNIFEGWNRIKNLNKEVKMKVVEIKQIFESFEMTTLLQVENFIEKKSEFYSNYNLPIIVLRTKIKSLKLSFETFRNKTNEIMPQITPSVMDFMADYGCNLFMANLEKEATFLIINVTNVQLTITKDLEQAETLLFVLSKLLTMTPVEFLVDKSVEKALSSLD